jgi:hypothetical protein
MKKKDKLAEKATKIAERLVNEKGEIELYDKDGKLKPGLHKWSDLKEKTRRRRAN